MDQESDSTADSWASPIFICEESAIIIIAIIIVIFILVTSEVSHRHVHLAYFVLTRLGDGCVDFFFAGVPTTHTTWGHTAGESPAGVHPLRPHPAHGGLRACFLWWTAGPSKSFAQWPRAAPAFQLHSHRLVQHGCDFWSCSLTSGFSFFFFLSFFFSLRKQLKWCWGAFWVIFDLSGFTVFNPWSRQRRATVELVQSLRVLKGHWSLKLKASFQGLENH